jgi:hypothetical protein
MLKRQALDDGQTRPGGQHPMTWVVLAVAFAGAAVMQVFLAASTTLWWPLIVALALAAAAVACGVQAARCRVRK